MVTLLFLVVVNGKHILNIFLSLRFVTSLHEPFFNWVCAFIVLSSVRLIFRPVEVRYQLTVKWAKIFICGNFSLFIIHYFLQKLYQAKFDIIIQIQNSTVPCNTLEIFLFVFCYKGNEI